MRTRISLNLKPVTEDSPPVNRMTSCILLNRFGEIGFGYRTGVDSFVGEMSWNFGKPVFWCRPPCVKLPTAKP